MKNVKVVFAIIVCTGIIYVLNAVIYELSYGLIRTLRRALPLGGYAVIVCMYLIPVLSISMVAFISGFVFWVSLKMVRLGAIVYIVLDCLVSVKSYTFASLQATKCFSFLVPSAMVISHAIVLVVVLISSRNLYLAGRKLRGKIRKTPIPN